MSTDPAGRPRDIWESKTKAKKKRRISPNAAVSLKKAIDQGWDYFWSRRKTNSFHLGHWSK